MTKIQKEKQKTIRKAPARSKSRLVSVNKALVFIIFVIGLFFVLSVNDLSIKSFVLQDLKIREDALSEEKKEIELQIAKRKTFEYINERAISLNMVKVDKIDYIRADEPQVARK